MVLTQPMHNAVAALIMAPIAIDIANHLGSSPKAFALAVMVGASSSFLMPYGHPAVILIKEPGEYKVKDYIKYGIGLNIIALLVVALIIPLLWAV